MKRANVGPRDLPAIAGSSLLTLIIDIDYLLRTNARFPRPTRRNLVGRTERYLENDAFVTSFTRDTGLAGISLSGALQAGTKTPILYQTSRRLSESSPLETAPTRFPCSRRSVSSIAPAR